MSKLLLIVSLCVASCVAQQLARETCDANRRKAEVQVASAQVVLGGLFEIRQPGTDGYGCGQPAPDLMQIYEAARWTISLLNSRNSNQGFIPAIRFGLQAYDTCFSAEPSLGAVYDLYPQASSKSMYCTSSNTQAFAGFVGPLSSWTSLSVAGLLKKLNMPAVAPRPMSSALSNMNLYPTFYRTSPSSAALVRATNALLDRLQWNKIIMVYSDSEYGRDGLKNMLEFAVNSGRCIVQAIPIKSGETEAQFASRLSAVQQYDVNGGLFWGSAAESNAAIAALQRLNQAASYGHIQWIFTDLDTSKSYSERIARGALVILPTSTVIEEFRRYWAGLNPNSPSNENPWFMDWYMTKYQCRLTGINYQPYVSLPGCTVDVTARYNNYVQNPYVESTVKAVFAYAAAFKNAHRDFCTNRGRSGFCEDLKRINPVTLNAYLKTLRYTFTAEDGMASMVGKSIEFDDNGDPVTSSFTVWNYVNNVFERVGNYSNNALNLDASSITFYASDRSTQLSSPPTSLCPAGGCQNCLMPTNNIQYTYIPGDIILGGMVGVRNTGTDPMTCTDISSLGSEALLALKYGLMTFRDALGSNILNGVELGALVADTCNRYIADAFLSELLGGKKSFKDTSGGSIDTEFLTSFINFRESSLAVATSNILGQYKMPEIESAATAPSLNNKMMYPYFNRALPSGDAMNLAIINVLKRQRWSYIQILYRSDVFGQEQMMSFKKEAAKANICVAAAHSLTVGGSAVLDKLREHMEARAVVVFGYDSDIRGIFEAMKINNAKGEFVLVGSDNWGDRASIVSGYEDVADGSFTVKLAPPDATGFDNYLRNLTWNTIKADPVMSQLYEKTFSCYINAGDRGRYNTQCFPQVLSSTSPYSPFVVSAVYSMALALHNTLQQVCGNNYRGLCNDFRNKDDVSTKLLQQLRNISYVNRRTSQTFSIVKGEGIADFDIFNYQNGAGFGGYIPVGKYQTASGTISNFQDSNIRLPNGAGSTTFLSQCMSKCLQCYMYQQQPFLYIPGDVLIGGMFSVSNSGNQGPFVCGSVKTTNGFQYTAAMQYAIQTVNNKEAPVGLNGIKLGGLALDHCNNQDRPFSLLSSIYSGMMEQSLPMTGSSGNRKPLSRSIAAWITDNTASTREAGEFLQPFNIPIVSPSATSESLKNLTSFYRTTQGDDTVAMAIVKIVKSLNLPYVQLVHSANSYGRGGLSAIQAAGQQEGICVISSIEFDATMSSNDVIQKLTESPTYAIILFLSTFDMTRLMEAKARSTSANVARLVFVSPEPYTSVVQSVGSAAARLLSIRLKTPTLTSYNNYLGSKTQSYYTDNPYFAKYYMAIYTCNLPGYYMYNNTCASPPAPLSASTNFAQSNFILATINAVYAATYTLDATLKELCGDDYNGICPEFSNANDLTARLVDNLRLTSFDNMGNSFRFLNREGNSGYEILRFDGINYQIVGSYEGAALQVNAGLSALYSDVPSQCNSDCLECIQRGLNFSYVPGDILLGGIFDVHVKDVNPFRCGDINTLHGFQLLEAFHFALERVNSKEGMFANILKGTTLGGVGLDSCESAIRTGYLVSNMHNGLTSLAKNGYIVDPDLIDLYLGGYSSDRSIYLARILSDLKIPQISYAATSTALLDRYRYPYFYRTVPADDKQVQAMITFLNSKDIRYVQVLYAQSNYGEFGAAAFKRLAPQKRICVAQMVMFPDNGTVSRESSNDVVTQILAKPVANTIVVFAGTSYINALLRAVQRNPRAIGKFRFLGSETWGKNEDAILGVEEIAKGSVTFSLKTVNLKVYDDYLSGKTPANSQDNPWFKEYYEEIQNCYLTVSDGKYTRKCPQTPGNLISSIRYKQDPGVLHVINSVYAAAFAIDTTLKEMCGENYTAVCKAYRNGPDTKDVILRNLQNVNFPDPSGDNFNFTDRREGSKGYDIYDIRFIPVEGYVYRKIGTYSSSGTIDVPAYTPDWDGSCTRQEACSECPTIRNSGIRYAISGPPTAVTNPLNVIGIFDVHNQGTDAYRCGTLRMDGYRQFSAFFYVMQTLSSTFNLNIRAVAIDTCSNSLRVGQDIYNLLEGKGLCNSDFIDDYGSIRLNNIGGFITAGNENTREASRVLNAFKVAYISPSAPSIIFNNTDLYPYLARTTAPKGQLLRGIAELMKEMGWSYVTAVSSSWRFDDGGYTQFLSVSGGRTCVRSSFNLPINPTMEDSTEAVKQLLAAEGSNVVLLFTTHQDTLLILRAAKDLNVLEKFLWVFTDPEATSWTMPSDYYFKALMLKPREGNVQGYINYETEMTYLSNSDHNDKSIPKSWYEEFYQRHFKCRLSDADVVVTAFTRECTRREIFGGAYNATQDRYTLSTVAASYALVNGLYNFRSANCGIQTTQDCLASLSTARERMFSSLLNISSVPLHDIANINTGGIFNLFFNKERFWDAGYAIVAYDYRKSAPGQEIGDWGSNALTINNKGSLSTFLSNCPSNQECGCAKPTEPTTLPVKGPSYTGPRNYYKYADDGTRIYDWPVWAIVVAVLTSIGILVTIIITLVLLLTYPIRGGTTILGFMVLLGILGIYGVNFAFFLPASFDTCAARRFCMGVIYMIVFAALLVKAVDNWRYGDLSWENQKKYRGLTSACSLFLIAVGIVLVQAIIPIMWLILIPPTASRVMDVNGNVADLLHDHMWCDPTDMYDIALVLSFIFVMFIVLLTSIFSAMAWDSEVNNRESRWILISCICTAGCFLVWMIVTTSAGPTYRDPAVVIANFVNATALLICLPLRKMCLLIAYKRDEKLDKEDPGDYEIYSQPTAEYTNNAYDPDYDFQRQDSKQDSDVGF
ncbi:uncharacterized protein [Haliotis asinina]|uniref:uncharacterized protein n=1 Tax=Haliotis asinina TaxID=109174 RepID=UPI0035321ACD